MTNKRLKPWKRPPLHPTETPNFIKMVKPHKESHDVFMEDLEESKNFEQME